MSLQCMPHMAGTRPGAPAQPPKDRDQRGLSTQATSDTRRVDDPGAHAEGKLLDTHGRVPPTDNLHASKTQGGNAVKPPGASQGGWDGE